MSDKTGTLYRVALKVAPTPAHPIYYEWQVAIFSVWVFADSEEDAAEKAHVFTKPLPYEVLSPEFLVERVLPKGKDSVPGSQWEIQGERTARFIGLGYYLVCAAVGSDPANFMEMSIREIEACGFKGSWKENRKQ